MAEKQVRKQKGMLSRLLRIGRHRSHRNVDNTANDDGSAQSAELASNRIGRCAGGVDEARWMPPASTEHDSASTRQQPAQRYPRDVAGIASSSKTNEDGDETQDSDATTASSSSESDMLEDIDRKITRLLEQMDAQQEKIKNLEAQVQQERAEKDQLQMQNAQLKSDLQRARVKKGNVREESIKTLTSRTIELQKTCDQMTQVMARKEKEFRGAFQKMREEMKAELNKQKEQTKAIEQLNKQSKEYQTIINEVSQLRKQMQKARDDSQRTSDATEQTVTTNLPEQLQKIRQETNTENIKQKIPHIAVKQPQVKQKEMRKDSQQPSTSAREQTEESGRLKLREYKTDDELNEALRLTGNDPYMSPVYNVIKARQRGMANGVTYYIQVFGYPWNNPDVWIYVIRDGFFGNIYIWTNPMKTIADNTLEAAVGELDGCCKIRPPQYLYSPRHITSKVIEICSRLTKRKWEWASYQYHYFFMNEQQQKIVSEMNVELPSGYRFDGVRLNRREYKCFPCVAVRRGDQLMCIGYLSFGYEGEYGYYNENYSPIPKEDESSVLSALETRVYQECISQRFCPLQSVWVDGKGKLDKYNNSGLWTRLQDGDGNAIVVNRIYN